MRKPAFTKRTRTLPVIGVVAVDGKGANSEYDALIALDLLLKATPLTR